MSIEQEIIEGYSISTQQLATWRAGIKAGLHNCVTSISLLLPGSISRERIEEALRRIIRRHEILRSTFPLAEEIGVPLQVVNDQPVLEFEYLETSAASEASNIDALRPGVHARLTWLDENYYRLMISTSALMADARSALLIARELIAALSQPGDEFEDSVPQYSQYVEYLQGWRDSEEAEEAKLWWRDHDTSSMSPLMLPFMQATIGAIQFDSIVLSISEKLAMRLNEIAGDRQLSFEALLLACWTAILMRVSDRREVAISVETSGRTLEDVEHMPGPFSRCLPVGFSIDEGDSFVDLWRRVDKRLGEVQQNEDGAPELDHHSGARFSWLDTNEILLSDSIQIEDVFSCSLPFDLRIAALRMAAGLRARLDFNMQAINRAEASLLARYLENALVKIAENIQVRANRIDLLDSELRRLVCHDWNQTQRQLLEGRAFPTVFEERAEQHSHRLAVRQGDRELTYEKLKELVDVYSLELNQRGAGLESVVAVTADPSIESVIGILAIMQAGAVFLPVDPTHPKERLVWILQQAGVDTVLCRPGEESNFPEGSWTTIAIDTQHVAPGHTTSHFAPAPQNAAYVIYTSGSTGQPKGVVVSHASLSNYLDWCIRDYAKSGSGCALHSSLAFDLSITSLLVPLMLGEPVNLPDIEQRADYLPSLLDERENYRWIKLTPSHARLAAGQVSAKTALNCTKTLILGGESLSSRDVVEWAKVSAEVEVINEYGPTEATVGCAVYRAPAAALNDGPVPIGRPIANTSIYLLDEDLEPSPIGVPGELYISGDCLARGYLRRPDLTAERFIPNPYTDQPGMRMYCTGDIGRYRIDGCLEYLGRGDDQVKIQGHRVELGEIEQALLQHESIREAVVMAKSERDAARLIAYFTKTEGAPENLALGELREFLAAKLPPYMIPHAYVPLDSLPLNANGKIDRVTLVRLELSAPGSTGVYTGPRTLEEEVLATVWAKVLGLERVSIDADYFLLGGDSIRAIQIAGIAAESGLNINLDMIFRHKTIRELAAAIAGPTALVRVSSVPFSLISEEDSRRMPVDAEDGYGLSRLQAGMVFERQVHPGAAIYHDIFSFHVRMPLDRIALERAVAELVTRHPMLRTSFHLEGFSEPLQIVHRTAPPPITFEDLQGLSRQEQRESVARWMEEEKRIGFDYLNPPLLRFRAHETSPDSFYYSLSFHHAILDGWSDASMLVELGLSYYRLLSGKPIGIDAPASQYRDFIAAERAASHSAEHRRYWLELLKGCTPVTIPRWSRPGDDGRRGVRMHRVTIGKERSRALINLARELAIPLKSVLLAAHLRVMSFVSGLKDVVTTISSAGRLETVDGHRVIGLHLNSTPLRLSLDGGRWVELAKVAFAAERDALPWRRYPLADIQRDLGFRRLSETSFYYTHYHLVENLSELPDFEILDQLGYEETSFALVANFSLNPHTSEISLDLAYDTTELPLEQVQALGGYYDRALASMAMEPLTNYSHVPLLSEVEKSQTVDHAFGPVHETPTGTIITMLEDCVRRAPQQQAVVCGAVALSYEEFNRRVNQLARYLRRHGAGPDVRIALVLDRSVEMMVAIFAVLKAGAAYVPVEPNQPDERIKAIIDDATPAAVVTTRKYADKIKALTPVASALISDFTVQPMRSLCLLGSRDLNNHRDTENTENALSRTFKRSISEESDSNLDDATAPDNLAYLIYTSGSTGRPKGTLVSRRNLLHSTAARLQWYDQPPGRFLLLSPYSFDSSIAGIFWTLCSGGTLVLTPGELHKDPAAIADLIETEKITFTLTVPVLYANLLQSCAGRSLPEWKTAIVAGQACPMELVRNHDQLFPAVALYDEYGPTEATVWSTAERCVASDDVVLIGKPVPYANNYILDHALMPVPAGTQGELYIGGAGVARGYLNLPKITAEKFLPDPFSPTPGARMYRTGDRALARPDGRIEYLGRVDWQLKIRGHRIEPEEIETVIRSIAGVCDAAVGASSQTSGDPRLAAYIVAEDHREPPSLQSIRAELDRLLPAYMVPSLYVFMEGLPVSANGKLDRKQLPEAREAGWTGTQYVAPRNQTEQTLADIWSAVLQVPRVGIDDDFFALGGDSILSIQVVARAKSAGIPLTPVQLLSARTIRALIRMLQSEADDSAMQVTTVDLERDAILEADIYPEAPWHAESFEFKQIFLTGSTGFLGAFLLAELLKQTQARIFCLVRADNSMTGARKIKETLESFKVWNEAYEERIVSVPGDLSQPLLGLSPDRFHTLAATIDAIYHNGAAVNFIHPYSALKPVNVEGTREALKLACRIKSKPFYYVSTLSVFTPHSSKETFLEEDEPALPVGVGHRQPDGYAQSKWVAERLVLSARSRGLPVSIFRPGRIMGHSITGVTNLSDFSSRFIKGCIQLGLIPDWYGAVNFITVDYVSQALAHLSLHQDSLGKAFHFYHAQPARWRDMVDWIRSYGYAIQPASYAQWRDGIERSVDNALHPLLPILPEAGFESEYAIPEISSERIVEFDCRNTLTALANSSIECPPLNSMLLNSYLSYLVERKFLNAPAKTASG